MNETVRLKNPVERLSRLLAGDVEAAGALISKRMHSDHARRIDELATHIFGAGGKRLRPLLVLASARACGYEGEAHIKLAAAVEYIHTATLLHDDVVDESAKRRGRPTANILWDNKSSVLVGDFLFARSFELMVETGQIKVLDILARAAAIIAEGEVLQLSISHAIDTPEELYFRVIEAKTAALFSAACEAGAVIAGASEERQNALAEFGKKLGIAFQITDDCLDYSGLERFGKEPGNDFREAKATLPIIRAIKFSRQSGNAAEQEFWARVLSEARQEEGDFARACEILERSGALASCHETALGLASEARGHIDGLLEKDMKDIEEIPSLLCDLADYAVHRLE